jgi:hypothetical protein
MAKMTAAQKWEAMKKEGRLPTPLPKPPTNRGPHGTWYVLVGVPSEGAADDLPAPFMHREPDCAALVSKTKGNKKWRVRQATEDEIAWRVANKKICHLCS